MYTKHRLRINKLFHLVTVIINITLNTYYLRYQVHKQSRIVFLVKININVFNTNIFFNNLIYVIYSKQNDFNGPKRNQKRL